jgi:hypothetical protein
VLLVISDEVELVIPVEFVIIISESPPLAIIVLLSTIKEELVSDDSGRGCPRQSRLGLLYTLEQEPTIVESVLLVISDEVELVIPVEFVIIISGSGSPRQSRLGFLLSS